MTKEKQMIQKSVVIGMLTEYFLSVNTAIDNANDRLHDEMKRLGLINV